MKNSALVITNQKVKKGTRSQFVHNELLSLSNSDKIGDQGISPQTKQNDISVF